MPVIRYYYFLHKCFHFRKVFLWEINDIMLLKLEILKTWLAKDENRENVPLDQLEIVMGELRNRDVGIRGSNIFTITYPLLWNVSFQKSFQ